MEKKDFKKKIDREREIHEFIYTYFPKEDTDSKRWTEIYAVMKFLYDKRQEIESIEKCESPDFIATFKSKEKIGIELTEIKNKDTKRVKEIESTKQLLTKAEEIFSKKYPEQRILVNFSLCNNRINFNKAKSDNYAKEIVEYVYAKINNNEYIKLEYINDLSIYPHSRISFNSRECWSVEDVNKNVIQENIKKKESKLPNYKQRNTDIDKFWLLMTINKSSTSYDIDNLIGNYPLQSDFDMIFLYCSFNEKIIYLKG